MAFSGNAAAIKEEDGENSGLSSVVSSDQELRDKFRKDVQRLLELKKRALVLHASGSSAQPPPPLPTPVQVQPPPSPLLPDLPPPAHHSWARAKRPATRPPPGFPGVRQPPPKLYQRRPPAQPQPPAPSVHRTPATPSATASAQLARHAPVPQPAPNACRAFTLPAASPPAHRGPAGGAIMPPPLKRRSAPPKPPKHPAAKKRLTVPCTFCGVLCMTAWHLKQHEKGRKHQNKVAYLAGEMNVKCPVCDVHLSGTLNVEQHYAGKLHAWRVKLISGGV